MRPRTDGPPAPLRWFATKLVRGPETGYVLGDLDEAFERDVERGTSRGRANVRYFRNVVHSAFSVSSARRQGGMRGERVRERITGSGGRFTSGISWLDVKLGLRMLVKQPGLTLVAVFALAIGIPVGMYPTHLVSVMEAPLPVDEGDRIQMLRYFNVATSDDQAASLQDFARWRDELTSFEGVGAATIGAAYNVISEDGRAAPVQGAEVSAYMFDMLRVPPLLGRTLISADEVIGAPDVAVIGHDLWQARLGGDPEIVGRTIRIGGIQRTVVGIMPEQFLYPFRDNLWLPLRVSAVADAAGQYRVPVIFGRLADGVTPEEAQAELTTVGRQMAIEFPETHARLQPEVVPFGIGMAGSPKGGLGADPEFYAIQALALLVLVVACANVGMLVFARTARRSSELAVRTALGASRTRVISQLFVEALLFAILAAGTGLLIGDRVILTFAQPILEQSPIPSWLDFGVTRETVFWALSLAVFSAVFAGVIPALKVTGRAVQRNLQRAAAGRSGIRFGGISSALIVGDVALAVAAVGVAVAYGFGLSGFRADGTGGLSEEFLAAELTIPGIVGSSDRAFDDPSEAMARVGAVQEELVRRLRAEPGIRGVAVGSALPGMDHDGQVVQLDGQDPSDPSNDYRLDSASSVYIDPGFFSTFEQPILSGRGFDLGDLGEDRSAVIVNTDFVDRVLDGRNPIGRRLRYRTSRAPEFGPWHEIVGVVGPLGTLMMNSEPRQYEAIYHPLAPGEIPTLHVAIHVGDDPESFAPRLRRLASEVHPAAMISDPVALNEVLSFMRIASLIVMWGAGLLIAILVALSASGTYALMSFTVTERTREIGVRTALGAQRRSIALMVARRAIAQLGIGILLGAPFAARMFAATERVTGQIPTRSPILLTIAVGVIVMALIGTIACTAPTLRALSIMPTEALREGG